MVEERVSKYSFWGEVGNFLTHALATAGIAWSLVLSDDHLYQFLSFTVGLTFFFSTVYHGAGMLNLKKSIVDRFRRMDILSIYVTIIMSGLVWGMKVDTNPYIIMGMLIPLASIFYWATRNYGSDIFEERHTTLTVVSSLMSTVMFYCGAWNFEQFLWFTGGAALYGAGTVVYVSKEREWSHALWHVFSSSAAALHLLGLNYS